MLIAARPLQGSVGAAAGRRGHAAAALFLLAAVLVHSVDLHGAGLGGGKGNLTISTVVSVETNWIFSYPVFFVVCRQRRLPQPGLGGGVGVEHLPGNMDLY